MSASGGRRQAPLSFSDGQVGPEGGSGTWNPFQDSRSPSTGPGGIRAPGQSSRRRNGEDGVLSPGAGSHSEGGPGAICRIVCFSAGLKAAERYAGSRRVPDPMSGICPIPAAAARADKGAAPAVLPRCKRREAAQEFASVRVTDRSRPALQGFPEQWISGPQTVSQPQTPAEKETGPKRSSLPATSSIRTCPRRNRLTGRCPPIVRIPA